MADALHFLVLTVAGWVNRHQEDLIDYLREENRVLREQLGRRPLRLTDAQRRRLAVRGKQLGRRGLAQVAGIVTPDMILRWYRRLIGRKYDGSPRRRGSRPMTPLEIVDLVVRMAVDNPTWGYTRIRGALSNLGHAIARRAAACAPRRTAQLLLSRGRVSGRPTNRTLRRSIALEVFFGRVASADSETAGVDRRQLRRGRLRPWRFGFRSFEGGVDGGQGVVAELVVARLLRRVWPI